MAEQTQSPPKHKGDGNAGFLRAARDGNLEDVLHYVRSGIDINTSNPNGLNALHLAAKEGHVKVVSELLRRGANVEAATKKGNTALHIASLAGHEEIVRRIVESGAQVNLQAQAGFTPLYMASQEGHAEVVKYLLSNGANQGLSTEDGFTPLAVALQQGHDKVVSVLLEHDAKGKVRLPALHIAAKKDDVKSAALLLQNEQNSVELQTKGGLVNDTTKSGFTPLHIAAHYGNMNVAKLLIQRNADVNFKAKNNITPLHVASRWGKLNMVKLLLDNNANIDEKTRDGLTPLHCAARSGHDAVVDALLESGAPNSAKTKNGLTPLHMAAQGDHEDCARLLLYHKASLNEVTIDYLTPLHVAAHCGNVKTAKLLLDRKCEPNARALNGFTPLHIACKKNRIKIVELLLKYGASIESKTESGLTPLHVASFMGHMNIVIYLIQHNANPNTTTVRGETSLHLAARANQSDIIRILLRNGATVDARAREQQTPLHIASRLGNVDNVVLLLQHGAVVDAATKDKYTPLHIAAKEGHDEVAQVLLEHEAQHDVTTKKGFTPLHIAAKYGNIKVANLLLQKEANPNVKGKNGLTPLHVATHYNHANVAQLLLENKADPHATAKNGYTPLHIAAKKNQMDIATMLLEYGAKPNAESKNGFTPLHLASQEGHTDIVSLLLEKDADVNCQAQNGLTPIHLAAQEDHVPVAEILCKYDAKTDTSTKAGYTPLHTACHFGQVNMARFLLNHGASVNATTKVGYTPLHQAAQQGHVQVVSLLLKNQASPNAVTNNGSTPLAIAQKLGYVSVVDILKPVTDVQAIIPATEDKYKVVSPEIMQETFISDSEDEGEDFLPQSPIFDKPRSEHDQLAYLPYSEGQKVQQRHDKRNSYISRDDSMSLERGGSTSPLDISFDKEYMDAQITSQSFHQMFEAAPQTSSRLHAGTDVHRYSSYSGSSFSTSFDPDNVPVDRSPVYSGFLISFMVDARGGAMRGCRHPGVRIIIPPRKCCMPTRITCRLVRREKLTKPPPMLEGEGLAARVLEMGPVGTKFLGPVLLEVPHFASLRGREREVVILRSDNGESWYEHPTQATEDAVTEALGTSIEGGIHGSQASMSSLWQLDNEEDLSKKRIKRILTTDLPQYFALVTRVTRVKQESTVIGMEGGLLSSNVVPQVQAVLPEGTLTRPIPVGLQAQPIAPELVAKLLGNRVAVSPIVTIEPRRRKFHKPITLTIPVPRAAQKGMINQYGGDRPTLRLLFSLAGNSTHSRADPNPAVWEDVTESKPMTLVDDCVSFTTTVSARFWLIDCQNVSEASQMASILYQEAVTVPYMAKFVVFAKRDSPEEGKLRIFCMTDDKDDKTLEKQEKFFEVARSRDIEVLEGRPQFVEMAGNLIPVTKSGDQLHVNFRPFRENRLPCTVKVRDQEQEASARIAFMKEPKVQRGEAPQTPICNLNIRLPDLVSSESGELNADKAAEFRKRHDFLRGQGLVIQDSVHRAEMKLSDVADALQGDWVVLAQQLQISISDINHIKNDYNTVGDQALAMLHLWIQKNPDRVTDNQLESALRRINREDIVKKCIHNVVKVEDEEEAAAARAEIEQSGYNAFKADRSSARDAFKRDMSLDVQYDEQDIIKESESLAEDSPTSHKSLPEDVSYEAPASRPHSVSEDVVEVAVDSRRPQAEAQKSPQEVEEEIRRKKEAYADLILQLEQFNDMQECHSGRRDSDERSVQSVQEDEIVKCCRTGPDALVSSVTAESSYSQSRLEQHSELTLRETDTLSDHPGKVRPDDMYQEFEEVQTPPPSPTECLDSDEPVLTRESSIAEVATRLVTTADEQYDSEDRDVPQKAYGLHRTEPEVLYSQAGTLSGDTDVPLKAYGLHRTEPEVLYSRAETLSEEAAVHTHQRTQVVTSQPPSQIVSPSSEGGHSYSDQPAAVPEPALPEGFRADENAYYEDEDTDYEKVQYEDARDESYDFQRGSERYGDLSSDADTYRTANQSLDDRLDQSRYSDADGGRYVFTQRPQEVGEDLQDQTLRAEDGDYGNYLGEKAHTEVTYSYQEDESYFGEDSYELVEDDSKKDKAEADKVNELSKVRPGDMVLTHLPENVGSSVDYIGSPVDPVTHSQSKYSEVKYTLETAGSERERDSATSTTVQQTGTLGQLSTELGEEDFVDRREEILLPKKYTLSAEDISDKSAGFQSTSYSYPVAAPRTLVGTAIVVDESALDDDSSEGAHFEASTAAYTTGPSSLEGTSVDVHVVGGIVPQVEEVDVDEYEELLPDGTVHYTRRVRSHSFKKLEKDVHIQDSVQGRVEAELVPDLEREDVVETFDEPPRVLRETENVEQILEDGSRVQRKVVYSRMVHHTRARQETFDASQGRQTEDFEVSEIVPGTMSAFVEGSDSDESDYYDDEEEGEHVEGQDVRDMEESTQVMDDGTVVTNRLLVANLSRKSRSRSGSIEETQEHARIEEECVTPRSRSPVGDISYDLTGKQAVSTTTRSAHVEVSLQQDMLERSWELIEDEYNRAALDVPEHDKERDKTASGDVFSDVGETHSVSHDTEDELSGLQASTRTIEKGEGFGEEEHKMGKEEETLFREQLMTEVEEEHLDQGESYPELADYTLDKEKEHQKDLSDMKDIDEEASGKMKEEMEAIEKVVARMEDSFKVTSSKMHKEVITVDSGRLVSEGREDVQEVAKEEYRSLLVEDGSETTQDVSDIRSELLESLESQHELDTSKEHDSEMSESEHVVLQTQTTVIDASRSELKMEAGFEYDDEEDDDHFSDTRETLDEGEQQEFESLQAVEQDEEQYFLASAVITETLEKAQAVVAESAEKSEAAIEESLKEATVGESLEEKAETVIEESLEKAEVEVAVSFEEAEAMIAESFEQAEAMIAESLGRSWIDVAESADKDEAEVAKPIEKGETKIADICEKDEAGIESLEKAHVEVEESFVKAEAVIAESFQKAEAVIAESLDKSMIEIVESTEKPQGEVTDPFKKSQAEVAESMVKSGVELGESLEKFQVEIVESFEMAEAVIKSLVMSQTEIEETYEKTSIVVSIDHMAASGRDTDDLCMEEERVFVDMIRDDAIGSVQESVVTESVEYVSEAIDSSGMPAAPVSDDVDFNGRKEIQVIYEPDSKTELAVTAEEEVEKEAKHAQEQIVEIKFTRADSEQDESELLEDKEAALFEATSEVLDLKEEDSARTESVSSHHVRDKGFEPHEAPRRPPFKRILTDEDLDSVAATVGSDSFVDEGEEESFYDVKENGEKTDMSEGISVEDLANETGSSHSYEAMNGLETKASLLLMTSKITEVDSGQGYEASDVSETKACLDALPNVASSRTLYEVMSLPDDVDSGQVLAEEGGLEFESHEDRSESEVNQVGRYVEDSQQSLDERAGMREGELEEELVECRKDYILYEKSELSMDIVHEEKVRTDILETKEDLGEAKRQKESAAEFKAVEEETEVKYKQEVERYEEFEHVEVEKMRDKIVMTSIESKSQESTGFVFLAQEELLSDKQERHVEKKSVDTDSFGVKVLEVSVTTESHVQPSVELQDELQDVSMEESTGAQSFTSGVCFEQVDEADQNVVEEHHLGDSMQEDKVSAERLSGCQDEDEFYYMGMEAADGSVEGAEDWELLDKDELTHEEIIQAATLVMAGEAKKLDEESGHGDEVITEGDDVISHTMYGIQGRLVLSAEEVDSGQLSEVSFEHLRETCAKEETREEITAVSVIQEDRGEEMSAVYLVKEERWEEKEDWMPATDHAKKESEEDISAADLAQDESEEEILIADLVKEESEEEISAADLDKKESEEDISAADIVKDESEEEISTADLVKEESEEDLIKEKSELKMSFVAFPKEESELEVSTAVENLVQHEKEIDISTDDLVQQERELEVSTEDLVQQERELEVSTEDLVQQERELEVSTEDIVQQERELEVSTEDLVQQERELEVSTEDLVQQERELDVSTEDLVRQERELEVSTQDLVRQERELEVSTQDLVQQGRELEVSTEDLVQQERELEVSTEDLVQQERELEVSTEDLVQQERELEVSTEDLVQQERGLDFSARGYIEEQRKELEISIKDLDREQVEEQSEEDTILDEDVEELKKDISDEGIEKQRNTLEVSSQDHLDKERGKTESAVVLVAEESKELTISVQGLGDENEDFLDENSVEEQRYGDTMPVEDHGKEIGEEISDEKFDDEEEREEVISAHHLVEHKREKISGHDLVKERADEEDISAPKTEKEEEREEYMSVHEIEEEEREKDISAHEIEEEEREEISAHEIEGEREEISTHEIEEESKEDISAHEIEEEESKEDISAYEIEEEGEREEDISAHEIEEESKEDISAHEIEEEGEREEDISAHEIEEEEEREEDISAHEIEEGGEREEIYTHEIEDEERKDISAHEIEEKEREDISAHEIEEEEEEEREDISAHEIEEREEISAHEIEEDEEKEENISVHEIEEEGEVISVHEIEEIERQDMSAHEIEEDEEKEENISVHEIEEEEEREDISAHEIEEKERQDISAHEIEEEEEEEEREDISAHEIEEEEDISAHEIEEEEREEDISAHEIEEEEEREEDISAHVIEEEEEREEDNVQQQREVLALFTSDHVEEQRQKEKISSQDLFEENREEISTQDIDEEEDRDEFYVHGTVEEEREELHVHGAIEEEREELYVHGTVEEEREELYVHGAVEEEREEDILAQEEKDELIISAKDHTEKLREDSFYQDMDNSCIEENISTESHADKERETVSARDSVDYEREVVVKDLFGEKRVDILDGGIIKQTSEEEISAKDLVEDEREVENEDLFEEKPDGIIDGSVVKQTSEEEISAEDLVEDEREVENEDLFEEKPYGIIDASVVKQTSEEEISAEDLVEDEREVEIEDLFEEKPDGIIDGNVVKQISEEEISAEDLVEDEILTEETGERTPREETSIDRIMDGVPDYNQHIETLQKEMVEHQGRFQVASGEESGSEYSLEDQEVLDKEHVLGQDLDKDDIDNGDSDNDNVLDDDINDDDAIIDQGEVCFKDVDKELDLEIEEQDHLTAALLSRYIRESEEEQGDRDGGEKTNVSRSVERYEAMEDVDESETATLVRFGKVDRPMFMETSLEQITEQSSESDLVRSQELSSTDDKYEDVESLVVDFLETLGEQMDLEALARHGEEERVSSVGTGLLLGEDERSEEGINYSDVKKNEDFDQAGEKHKEEIVLATLEDARNREHTECLVGKDVDSESETYGHAQDFVAIDVKAHSILDEEETYEDATDEPLKHEQDTHDFSADKVSDVYEVFERSSELFSQQEIENEHEIMCKISITTTDYSQYQVSEDDIETDHMIGQLDRSNEITCTELQKEDLSVADIRSCVEVVEEQIGGTETQLAETLSEGFETSSEEIVQTITKEEIEDLDSYVVESCEEPVQYVDRMEVMIEKPYPCVLETHSHEAVEQSMDRMETKYEKPDSGFLETSSHEETEQSVNRIEKELQMQDSSVLETILHEEQDESMDRIEEIEQIVERSEVQFQKEYSSTVETNLLDTLEQFDDGGETVFEKQDTSFLENMSREDSEQFVQRFEKTFQDKGFSDLETEQPVRRIEETFDKHEISDLETSDHEIEQPVRIEETFENEEFSHHEIEQSVRRIEETFEKEELSHHEIEQSIRRIEETFEKEEFSHHEIEQSVKRIEETFEKEEFSHHEVEQSVRRLEETFEKEEFFHHEIEQSVRRTEETFEIHELSHLETTDHEIEQPLRRTEEAFEKEELSDLEMSDHETEQSATYIEQTFEKEEMSDLETEQPIKIEETFEKEELSHHEIEQYVRRMEETFEKHELSHRETTDHEIEQPMRRTEETFEKKQLSDLEMSDHETEQSATCIEQTFEKEEMSDLETEQPVKTEETFEKEEMSDLETEQPIQIEETFEKEELSHHEIEQFVRRMEETFEKMSSDLETSDHEILEQFIDRTETLFEKPDPSVLDTSVHDGIEQSVDRIELKFEKYDSSIVDTSSREELMSVSSHETEFKMKDSHVVESSSHEKLMQSVSSHETEFKMKDSHTIESSSHEELMQSTSSLETEFKMKDSHVLESTSHEELMQSASSHETEFNMKDSHVLESSSHEKLEQFEHIETVFEKQQSSVSKTSSHKETGQFEKYDSSDLESSSHEELSQSVYIIETVFEKHDSSVQENSSDEELSQSADVVETGSVQETRSHEELSLSADVVETVFEKHDFIQETRSDEELSQSADVVETGSVQETISHEELSQSADVVEAVFEKHDFIQETSSHEELTQSAFLIETVFEKHDSSAPKASSQEEIETQFKEEESSVSTALSLKEDQESEEITSDIDAQENEKSYQSFTDRSELKIEKQDYSVLNTSSHDEIEQFVDRVEAIFEKEDTSIFVKSSYTESEHFVGTRETEVKLQDSSVLETSSKDECDRSADMSDTIFEKTDLLVLDASSCGKIEQSVDRIQGIVEQEDISVAETRSLEIIETSVDRVETILEKKDSYILETRLLDAMERSVDRMEVTVEDTGCSFVEIISHKVIEQAQEGIETVLEKPETSALETSSQEETEESFDRMEREVEKEEMSRVDYSSLEDVEQSMYRTETHFEQQDLSASESSSYEIVQPCRDTTEACFEHSVDVLGSGAVTEEESIKHLEDIAESSFVFVEGIEKEDEESFNKEDRKLDTCDTESHMDSRLLEDAFAEKFIDRAEHFMEMIHDVIRPDPDGRDRLPSSETTQGEPGQSQPDNLPHSRSPSTGHTRTDDDKGQPSGGSSTATSTFQTSTFENDYYIEESRYEVHDRPSEEQQIALNAEENQETDLDKDTSHQLNEEAKEGTPSRKVLGQSYMSASDYISSSDSEQFYITRRESTSFDVATSEAFTGSSYSAQSETMASSQFTLTESEHGHEADTEECGQGSDGEDPNGERKTSIYLSRKVLSERTSRRHDSYADSSSSEDEPGEALGHQELPQSTSGFTLVPTKEAEGYIVDLDSAQETATKNILADSSNMAQPVEQSHLDNVPVDISRCKDGWQGDGGQDYNDGGQDYNDGGQDYYEGGQDYYDGDQDYNEEGQDYNDEGQDYNEEKLGTENAVIEKPAPPTDFSSFASEDPSNLQQVAGVETTLSPDQHLGSPLQYDQDINRNNIEADSESSDSSDAALMLVLDRASATGTDNNTLSGISSESGQPLDGVDALREQFCEESPLDDLSEGREQFYQAYLKEIESEGGIVGVEEARHSEECTSSMRGELSSSEGDEREGAALRDSTSWDRCEDVVESQGSLHHKEGDYKEILSFEAGHSSPPMNFDVSREEMGQFKKVRLSINEFEERFCASAQEAMTRDHSEDTLHEEVEKEDQGLQEMDVQYGSPGDSDIGSTEQKTVEDQEEPVPWKQQMDDEFRRTFCVEQRQHDSYSQQGYSHTTEISQESTSFKETTKVTFGDSFIASSKFRSGYSENESGYSEYKSGYSTSFAELNQHDKLDTNLIHHYSQVEEHEKSGRQNEAAALTFQGVNKMSSYISEVHHLDDFKDKGETDHLRAHTSSGGFSIHTGSESRCSSSQGDEEVQSHRLMMKKEIHKRTLLGYDGQEHTSVYEDSQIQQDTEPPEELRESMQEIINQFMEMAPETGNLRLLDESVEEEV